MSEFIKVKISKRQFKELLNQFLQNSHFAKFKHVEDEYYAFVDKKGSTIINIYKFEKAYYLEIFSTS
jgi:hypothetical protein